MRHVGVILFFLLFVCVHNTTSQSVRFLNNNLDNAISMAQRSNKLIFVDTYAPWCKPCKKMEREFRNPKLANYFNKTFVNIRIDMDSEMGKQVHRNYDVIFLPTLMILDQEGRIKYKVDRLMSANALLDIAQKIAEPEIYSRKPAETYTEKSVPSIPEKRIVEDVAVEERVKKDPLPVTVPADQKATQKTQAPKVDVDIVYNEETNIIEGTITEEKILHIFDDESTDLPPSLLKHQAYLSLQLMDGSHKQASQKYLDTQTDWNTKENMQFIYDFLYTTDSKEFQHLLNNKASYEELVGKERVYQTISILVYDRLDRGFPRPTLEETKDLFTYLDVENFEKLAYEHYLEQLHKDEKFDEFKVKAEEYIQKVTAKNDQIWYRLANINSETEQGLDRSLSCINEAIKLNPYNYQYYDTQAYLFYLKGKKRKALSSANKSKSIAEKNGQVNEDIDILIQMINEDL